MLDLLYDIRNTPLIEHWDGSTWSIVPGAAVSGHLYSITALSASNIWAVGGMGNRLPRR
jgi:hypothetical protein